MKWEYIIAFFLALQALLYALIRISVKNRFDKKLESFKAELQRKTAGYMIQQDKIEEVSGKLVDLKNTWQSLTQVFHVGKPPDEAFLMQKAVMSTKALSHVYDMNKHVFTSKICDLFDDLFDKVNSAWRSYYLSRMMRTPQTVQKSTELYNNANKIATEELPEIIGTIQNEFRKILKID